MQALFIKGLHGGCGGVVPVHFGGGPPTSLGGKFWGENVVSPPHGTSPNMDFGGKNFGFTPHREEIFDIFNIINNLC